MQSTAIKMRSEEYMHRKNAGEVREGRRGGGGQGGWEGALLRHLCSLLHVEREGTKGGGNAGKEGRVRRMHTGG